MIPCLLFSIESATSIDLYDVYRYIGFRVMGSLYLRCHRLSFVQLCRPPPPPPYQASGFRALREVSVIRVHLLCTQLTIY